MQHVPPAPQPVLENIAAMEASVLDVDTSALLLFTIFPLLSLIHYLFFEHKRSHANNGSADRDFERLIAQFRAADPQRLGLSLESIEQLVGPSAVLREKVAEGGPLSRRITVAEFVPIACHLSTLPRRRANRRAVGQWRPRALASVPQRPNLMCSPHGRLELLRVLYEQRRGWPTR